MCAAAFRPICPLCKSAHFAREPHVFGKVDEPSELCRPAVNAPVNAVKDRVVKADKNINTKRRKYPNTDKNREYRRQYMAKRRKATKENRA